MTSDTGGRWRVTGRLALLAFALTPVTIVIHELGHFIVPLLSGLPAQLHPTHVSGGAELGHQASWLVALQAGGGPLMTVVMGVAGAFLYGKDSRRLAALAFSAAAVSRLFVAVAWLGLRVLLAMLRKPYRAHPNFDEHILAQALDVPPFVTALAAGLVLAAVLYWLFRHVPRGKRLLSLGTLTAAVVASNFAWRALAPDLLLAT